MYCVDSNVLCNSIVVNNVCNVIGLTNRNRGFKRNLKKITYPSLNCILV